MLHSVAAAVFVNRLLPCGAEYVSATKRGPYINALFKLTDRSGPAGPPTVARHRHHRAGELHHHQRQDHALAQSSEPAGRQPRQVRLRQLDETRRHPAPAPSRRGRRRLRSHPRRAPCRRRHRQARAPPPERLSERGAPFGDGQSASTSGNACGHDDYDAEGDGGDGSLQGARYLPFGDRRRGPRRIPAPGAAASPGSQRRLGGVDAAVRRGAGGLRADSQTSAGRRHRRSKQDVPGAHQRHRHPGPNPSIPMSTRGWRARSRAQTPARGQATGRTQRSADP